jgi:methylation protein EvaC
MANCRFCNFSTKPIVDFGPMPIANHFVRDITEDVYRFRLAASFCSNCHLFQLEEQPKPELMFHNNYPFFTGLSKAMTSHFSEMVDSSLREVNKAISDIQVLEIGCNDGTLLSNLAAAGVRHLGVDPSANVVEIARNKGVRAQVDFFGLDTAQKIKEANGDFDLILAANVICHIPDITDFALGIDQLLTSNGRFIFEEPYAGDVLSKSSYDQFYDEHVYIFSCLSVLKIFEKFDLELIDVKHQETHGGSMRYTIARKGSREVKREVSAQLDWEIKNGLDQSAAYLQFAENCTARKTELVDLLVKLKNEGKTVAGYAATSKSTTVLNYCGIDQSLISYISDSTPEKQGTFTPGSRIPVITPEDLRLRKPNFIVLFAWNHEIEILDKERELTSSGSKWIRFVPRIEII